MAIIKPFRGIRFNCSLVSDPGKVITPPYDVISEQEQERLHKKNPYNIVRLEYGKILPEDNEDNNRYSRAAETLEQWLNKNILMLEDKSSYYLYEQRFDYQGKTYTRRGIAAALKLQPYEDNIILPHERTMSGPKADRLELLKTTRTNTSPIFTLYPDQGNFVNEIFETVNGKTPVFDSGEHDDQSHRLWQIDDIDGISEITDHIKSQPLLIADGHHRYETALNYSQLSKGNIDKPSDYILTVMVSMFDPGLLVLPTHRLISGMTNTEVVNLQTILKDNFSIQPFSSTSEIDRSGFVAKLKNISSSNNGFGFINHDRACFLIPKKLEKQNEQPLPVELLHDLILEPLLDHDLVNKFGKERISYPHDIDSAIDAVLSRSADTAFILDTVPVNKVLNYSRAGKIMPQKTTFFYPKLPGGLVLYNMDRSF